MKLSMTAAILMTGVALAQTSPNVIRDNQYGVEYTVPAGWKAQPAEIGHVLTSPSHEGALLVFVHTTKDMAEAKRINAEPFAYKNLINLTPIRPAEVVNATTMVVDLQGTMGDRAARARLLMLLSPHGGAGLAVLSASSITNFGPEYVTLGETVARSAKFARTAAPTPTTSTSASSPVRPSDPGSSPWATKLRGKKLHYFTRYNGGSGGGMAGHKQIGLCSDGSFFFRGDFSASIYVPGATAGTGNRESNIGNWKVLADGANSVLLLSFEGGAQAKYTLSTQDTKTFLNGQRWLMEDATECR
jgi:hypothetical protein